MDKKDRNEGFNLVELIAAVAIAAIVLTIGVPSLLRLISGSAITGYADALTGGLAVARSEAILEKTTVTICKSADLLDCDNTVDWGDGWIVFVDLDGDQTVDAGDRMVRVHEALSSGVSLKYNNGSHVQYGYKGDLSPIGTFTFCPPNNEPSLARGLILANTGRVRNSSDSNADNVHEDGSGNDLACP